MADYSCSIRVETCWYSPLCSALIAVAASFCARSAPIFLLVRAPLLSTVSLLSVASTLDTQLIELCGLEVKPLLIYTSWAVAGARPKLCIVGRRRGGAEVAQKVCGNAQLYQPKKL